MGHCFPLGKMLAVHASLTAGKCMHATRKSIKIAGLDVQLWKEA